MHRSGTSLIAEMLQNMGLFIGKDLNIHYESKILVDINDFILSVAHGAWDYPLPIEKLLQNDKSFTNVINALQSSLNTIRFYKNFWGQKYPIFKTHSEIVWGWKEPRTTVTFPFWLRIFPDAKFIFIYRNGVDVANSLRIREQKREGDIKNKVYSLRNLDLNEAFKLWEEYNTLFLKYKSLIDSRNLFSFGYENFLQNPLQVINDIEKFLQIKFENSEIAVNRIRSDNSFKFKKDQDLYRLYSRVKNNESMKIFNYDNLV